VEASQELQQRKPAAEHEQEQQQEVEEPAAEHEQASKAAS
jgi:hypothetical protein